ncbi:hypothetical protein BCEP27_10720 [Burkholderia cepacia]
MDGPVSATYPIHFTHSEFSHVESPWIDDC